MLMKPLRKNTNSFLSLFLGGSDLEVGDMVQSFKSLTDAEQFLENKGLDILSIISLFSLSIRVFFSLYFLQEAIRKLRLY